MMTKKIHNRSTVNDIYALLGVIIRLGGGYDFSADVYLSSLFAEVKAWYARMTEAVNAETNRSVLAPLDLARDNAVRSLFYEVKSKCYWYDDAMKAAALRIYELLERYSIEIVGLSYAHETTQLNALLEDLKETELMSDIALLPGLDALIARVAQTQTAFETATDIQLSQQAEQKDVLSAYRIRQLVLAKLNRELLVYVAAMSNAAQGDYAAYAGELDEAIAENNSKVKTHLNKLKAEKEKDIPK